MYRDQHTSNTPYFSLLNAVLDRVSCRIHWIVTLFSNNRSWVLQSVSSAKWQMSWKYILGRVTTEFVTTESSSPIAIHTKMKIMYSEDTIDVNLDTGSVIL
jgi:hypothetical protein